MRPAIGAVGPPPLCEVCHEPLIVGSGWWRCRRLDHPRGGHMPDLSLGEVFGSPGRPWALLTAPHRRGIPGGWRDSYKPSQRREQ